MQITPKILSIPPYLSTTWDQITSLKTRIENNAYILCVTLKSGELVQVPNLDQPTIQAIFKAHAEHVEHPLDDVAKFPMPFSLALPLDKMEGSLTSLGHAMQHNPAQANLPDIPSEVLDKITIVVRAFGFEDLSSLPPPEENCNCIYCQMVRAFSKDSEHSKEVAISEEDLRFRDWEVEQTAEKLYIVTNPLDKNEQYHIFLGEPLGCTCGHKNCEHIRAVLHS